MKAIETLKRFVNDDRGLETVEYAIITGLIVVGVITTIVGIGQWVNLKFTTLNNTLAANP